MADENQEDVKPKKGKGLIRILIAVAVIGVLVGVELFAASMFIPSAQKTEDLARNLARASKGEEFSDEADSEDKAVIQDEETIEVQIHRANITRFDPDADKTLNIDFSIYGVVLASEEVDFTAAFEKNKSRIQEQVVMTMHGARTSDLSSAGLGLIKRQILEKTNRALGRPFVHEVIFTKINFVER